MNNKSRAFRVLLLSSLIILPVVASAKISSNSLAEQLVSQIRSRVCTNLKSNHAFINFSLPLPPFCNVIPPTPPPPTPEPTPPPPPTPSPEPTPPPPTPSPSPTPTPEPTPPPPTPSPEPPPPPPPPSPTPEPPPTLDHLVITEVYYDTSSTTAEVDPANEWIEIYNGTGIAVDIGGWVIADASAEFDLVPLGTIIPNNSFAIITASSTTAGFWSIPAGVQVVNLNTARLGNSLGNTGDNVFLKNSASTTVDAVSYGTGVASPAFTPTVPDVADGHSVGRINVTTDTDGASDWKDNAVPNPGNI